MSFTLDNSGKFLSRHDDFDYGIVFDSDNPSPVIDTLSSGYDSFGGGAGIVVDYHISDKTTIEFSFQGTSVSREKRGLLRKFRVVANSEALALPVIDGQFFGQNQDQQVALIDGDLRFKFEYDSWYVDTFLGLDRSLLKKSNTELHVIAGLAYARFEQDFKHIITGISVQNVDGLGNGISQSAKLDEDLRDNLFGLKGGLRLGYKVTKRFQFEGGVFSGVYYRSSKLDADQTMVNVDLVNVDPFNVNANRTDRDSDFVHRVEGNLKLKFMVNSRWGLEFSSGVGTWWGMSKVNNPEGTTNESMNPLGPVPINRPVHIGDNDRLMEYSVGLAITFRN